MSNFILAAVISTLFFVADSCVAEKIRVAVILPFSGDGASLGESLRRGMTLGIEKLSPQAKQSIEFVYEDDRLDPKTSLSAFSRINGEGKVDVVINLSSGTSQALAPVTESKKVVLLAVASDGSISAGRRYAFNFWVTPKAEVRVVLEEVRRRGYKKIARIQTTYSGVFAIRDEFDRQNSGDIQIVLDDDYPLETKDFRPWLAKLRPKIQEIDAIQVVLFPGQLSSFSKQLAAAGIKKPLFGYELFEDRNEVLQSNGTLVGSWYANAADSDGEFLKLFQQRYPGASSYAAATGHDAVLLLGAAIDKGVKPEELYSFIATLKDFTGAMGTFSSTGDQKFSLPAELKVVTNDGFERLKLKH